MNTKIVLLLFIIASGILTSGFAKGNPQHKDKSQNKNAEKVTAVKDSKEKEKVTATTKTDTLKSKEISEAGAVDSLKTDVNLKFKFYKKNAHASYYHNKFNGKRTASGKKFDNNKYTAAHKKLPFGTKVKITNETNGKSVIVEITDRGPFTKAREIDLSRKAFMDIASNKNSGSVIVKIEVEVK